MERLPTGGFAAEWDPYSAVQVSLSRVRNRTPVQFELRPAANTRDAAAGTHDLKRTTGGTGMEPLTSSGRQTKH